MDENGVRLMLLAGLYDCTYLEGASWNTSQLNRSFTLGSNKCEGSMEPLWTFTIVTTSACKEFEWLHDRQPVILSTREALNTWLDTSSQTWTATLAKLVQPYDCDSSGPLDWCMSILAQCSQKLNPSQLSSAQRSWQGWHRVSEFYRTNCDSQRWYPSNVQSSKGSPELTEAQA